MKHLCNTISELIKHPLLPLLAAVLGIFCFSGADKADNHRAAVITVPAAHHSAPLAPEPGRNREQTGNLQNAVPGSLPLSIVSRRNNEPVPLRIMRDNNAWSGHSKLYSVPLLFGETRQKYCSDFSFQSFLRRSLPPRAGPETV